VPTSPPLSRPVHFRIPEDRYRRYEAEAVAAGMRLSCFLRARLDAADAIAEELAQLRFTVLELTDEPSRPSMPAAPSDAADIEALLLLRTLVSPAQLRAVRAEMERCGLKPWSPPSVRTSGTGL